MEIPCGLEIKILTRGDDLDMLNEAITLVPYDNEMLVSYLCYLKAEIVEQLDRLDVEIPKEEYPVGHPKGFNEEEFEEYLDDYLKENYPKLKF